jgi:hypothetical protein
VIITVSDFGKDIKNAVLSPSKAQAGQSKAGYWDNRALRNSIRKDIKTA